MPSVIWRMRWTHAALNMFSTNWSYNGMFRDMIFKDEVERGKVLRNAMINWYK